MNKEQLVFWLEMLGSAARRGMMFYVFSSRGETANGKEHYRQLSVRYDNLATKIQARILRYAARSEHDWAFINAIAIRSIPATVTGPVVIGPLVGDEY